MNNDLISREALKKAIFNHFDGVIINNVNGAYIIRDINMIINNAPTIDISKKVWNKSNELLNKRLSYLGRTQGEWIVKSNGTTNYYACDKCGSAGDIQDKFCRECGADMRKGKEE